jgi:hypothetical protein
MKQIESIIQPHFYRGVKIMEAIGYFFNKVFVETFVRMFDQLRYRVTDTAESKMRDAMDKSFDRNKTDRQRNKTDYTDRNTGG